MELNHHDFSLESLVARLVVLTIVLVVSNVVRAQGRPPRTDPDKQKQTEGRQELEKKTLALLNDIASAGWSLKLPENRLFIMAGAADLLGRSTRSAHAVSIGKLSIQSI